MTFCVSQTETHARLIHTFANWPHQYPRLRCIWYCLIIPNAVLWDLNSVSFKCCIIRVLLRNRTKRFCFFITSYLCFLFVCLSTYLCRVCLLEQVAEVLWICGLTVFIIFAIFLSLSFQYFLCPFSPLIWKLNFTCKLDFLILSQHSGFLCCLLCIFFLSFLGLSLGIFIDWPVHLTLSWVNLMKPQHFLSTFSYNFYFH